MQNWTPEIFDALIIANIIIGLALAGRRFLRDIRGIVSDDAPNDAPIDAPDDAPDDAPSWAQASHHPAAARQPSASLSPGQDA